jgi:hypothetical protein
MMMMMMMMMIMMMFTLTELQHITEIYDQNTRKM